MCLFISVLFIFSCEWAMLYHFKFPYSTCLLYFRNVQLLLAYSSIFLISYCILTSVYSLLFPKCPAVSRLNRSLERKLNRGRQMRSPLIAFLPVICLSRHFGIRSKSGMLLKIPTVAREEILFLQGRGETHRRDVITWSDKV